MNLVGLEGKGGVSVGHIDRNLEKAYTSIVDVKGFDIIGGGGIKGNAGLSSSTISIVEVVPILLVGVGVDKRSG